MLSPTLRRMGGIAAFLFLIITHSLSAQKFSLADVRANRVGGLAVPGAKRALLFYAEKAHHDSTILRQYWLDEQMQLRRKQPLVLRGPYLLQSLIRSREHLMYRFKRQGYDTLVNVVVDTLGRTVAIRREKYMVRQSRFLQFQSLEMPQATGFALVDLVQNRSSRLRYYTPDMHLAWEKTFGSRMEIVGNDADSSHVWVVLTKNPLTRHPVSEAVCLELGTGKEVGRSRIGPQQSAWVPAAAHIGAGHELLLAGYAFRHAASRTHTGDLFYLRLSMAGQPMAQRLTTLAHTSELQAARGGRVHWTLVQPDRQGNVRLVGETFQSSSYGAVLLRSTLSFGLLQYSVLRPRDVISLTLDTAGLVRNVQTTALLRDRGSFTWPGYMPGRILADIAAQYQTFRYRGVASADNSTLILRSPQQVQTLNVANQQLTSIRQKPAVGVLDVWHVGSDFMLLYQEDAGKRTLEVERVPIDGRLPGQARK